MLLLFFFTTKIKTSWHNAPALFSAPASAATTILSMSISFSCPSSFSTRSIGAKTVILSFCSAVSLSAASSVMIAICNVLRCFVYHFAAARTLVSGLGSLPARSAAHTTKRASKQASTLHFSYYSCYFQHTDIHQYQRRERERGKQRSADRTQPVSRWFSSGNT